ncbi:MAG: UxaA family hydrolase [Candidatus Latescibacterota bacterium]|jgi:altronate dehydratase
MNQSYDFAEVARLPLAGDNVAIAVQRIEAGSEIRYGETRFQLDYTLMEGHRFAVEAIAQGDKLLSWGLPFGRALYDIEPGEYTRNAGMIAAISGRSIDFTLPEKPNFADHIEPYQLDRENFVASAQVKPHAEMRTFMGYVRPGERGVGTRNYIVVLGTSSRTTGYVRQLAALTHKMAANHADIDGVVAVAHTEGGNRTEPNNRELLLRTLAGFMVHANVGAVLAVDYGSEAITNADLRAYMEEHDYALAAVPHRFMSIEGGFVEQLEEGEKQIRAWLPQIDAVKRTPEPLSELRIALQCGGSDSFSGVSGNPLASWVAREVIRYGGGANLAETDELIGAEPYVLQKVRNAETAQRFLDMIANFKERVAWHGESAEGNPSGGNKFRGLYNIVLKSIGAAMKRHPDVRLDYCIDYGEPMREPGYYFMDSPGNDLESIAGQVASGCNAIFFVTGNGSITNFPFVPTLKIVTTSERYELLERDMDVNAGAYQDGVSMDELGANMLDLTVAVAGGQRSLGEQAGHSQVQIWRDWRQTNTDALQELSNREAPSGYGIRPEVDEVPAIEFEALRAEGGWVSDQVALIMPTSLCSGQVARMIAERLNERGLGSDRGISRFVALVHTEGCGVAGSTAEDIYARSMVSYLRHPLVRKALLLEHGCEKTHNDYMRNQLREFGMEEGDFGWASVQLDGGIDAAINKAEAFFTAALQDMTALESAPKGIDSLKVGLLSTGSLPQEAVEAMEQLVRWIAGAGGLVIIPAEDDLLATPTFVDGGLVGIEPRISLSYGELAQGPGLHIMETQSENWTEILTGLGATGVELIIAHSGDHPQQGHPLVPLLQVSSVERVQEVYGADIDIALAGDAANWAAQVLELITKTASRRYEPRARAQGNADFQFTRGLLGVSM